MMQLEKVFSKVVVSLMAVSIAVGTGCIRKRADKEVQGANLDQLVEISKVMEWDHNIASGAEESKGNTTASRELDIEKGLLNLSFPKIVSYTSTSPLLKGHIEDLKLYGFKNRKYSLKYVFTPSQLQIYKVIPSSDLSHYESPYAQKNGESVLVPLGGFEVSYFKVDHVKDNDNRKTNQLQKFFVEPKMFKTATHVSVDYTKFIEFGSKLKSDLFPADYFLSTNWYFSAAEVSKKPDQQDGIGYVDGIADVNGTKASLIHFTRTDNLLRATNAVKDERVALTEDQENLVFSIPAKWKKFRIKKEAGYATLSEEEVSKEVFSNKEWGALNLAGIVARGIGQVSVEDSIKGIVLDKIKFKKDSFSFTLLIVKDGNKVKFSFKRKKEKDDYTPRVYFKEDRSVFGSFSIDKFRVPNLDEVRSSDIEANILIQRFNPNKDITFRFSDITPPPGFKDVGLGVRFDFREMGRNCVRYWDRAFKLAGSSINIKLDETRDAELGDFDSNILNIVPVFSNSTAGGVAPSVSDPVTGEVIAATTNVFLTSGRVQMVAEAVRNYIRINGGIIDNPKLLDPDDKHLPILNHITKEIEAFCPQVKQFAEDVKENKVVVSTQLENKAVVPCVEELLKPRMQAVLCHEMGHNFGLRHNFFCSADGPNIAKTHKSLETLYPKKDFPELYDLYPKENLLPEMSCVMDYSEVEEHNRPAMPMLYDIAALGYIYSGKVLNKVDLESNVIKLADFDTSKEIVEQESYADSKKMKYCTDENSMFRAKGTAWDPMCDLWDNGVNPSDKIEHEFRKLRQTLILYGKKYDRAGAYSELALAGITGRALQTMSKIYGTWRAHLAGTLQTNNYYLTEFTGAQYKNHLSTLRANEGFTASNYIGVGETFYDILTAVFEMPDYFCVSKDAQGEPHFLKFTTLQDEIISKGETMVVNGCSDKRVRELLVDSRGLEYLFEYGIPTKSIKFSQDPTDAQEVSDIISASGAKQMASVFLTTRIAPSTYPMLRKSIFPALLDEPHLYSRFTRDLKNRVFAGMKADKPLRVKFKEHGVIVPEDVRFSLYSNIGADYTRALSSLLVYNQQQQTLPQSLIIKHGGGGGDASEDMISYVMKPHMSLNDVQKEKKYYTLGGVYYQPEVTGGFAYDLMMKIIELENDAKTQKASGEIVDGDILVEEANQLEGLKQMMKALPSATF